MAEHEHNWRTKHAHESHSIGFGHYGTASYDSLTREWNFLRDNPAQSFTLGRNEHAGGSSEYLPLFEIAGEVQQVHNTSATQTETVSSRLAGPEFKHCPESASAWSIVEDYSKASTSGSNQAMSLHGSKIAFGSALYLDLDDHIIDTQHMPVVAHVSGTAGDIVRVVCFDTEKTHIDTDDDTFRVELPAFSGPASAVHVDTSPILQVKFFSPDTRDHNSNHLLIRTSYGTIFFRLFLHSDGKLEMYRMLTITNENTGGHIQADADYFPADPLHFAIIDTQGNYSTWAIHGRRSPTARVLYHVRLQSNGKMFAFANRKRPEGIGLYFDGWHRVVPCSNTGDGVDRVFVCNRQHARLFDLYGDVVCDVDVRLDIDKEEMYITDVRSCVGARSNIVVVLTTARLLVFDLAQREWRNGAKTEEPMLLCSWNHHAAWGTDLRMTDVTVRGQTMLALYSSKSYVLSTCFLKFEQSDDRPTAHGSLLRTLDLRWSNTLRIAELRIVTTEISSMAGTWRRPDLLRIIAQHDDLSLYSSLVEVIDLPQTSAADSHEISHTLRLPPTRRILKKSRNYVSEELYQSVDGFVVSDNEDESAKDVGGNGLIQEQLFAESVKSKTTDLIRVYDDVSSFESKVMSEGIQELFTNLDETVREVIETGTSRGTTLDYLLPDDGVYRLEDIHAESSLLERILENCPIYREQKPHKLEDIYQQLFDVFVACLPPSVPAKARLERERLLRNIALELCLSRRILRVPVEGVSIMQASHAAPNETDSQASIVVAEPSSPPNVSSTPEAGVTSTTRRPLANDLSSPSMPHAFSTSQRHPISVEVSSPSLTSAISRLSALTFIAKPPESVTSTDNHISSLLAHMPADSSIDPSNYDWQSIELQSSSLSHKEAEMTAQEKRRADKRAADRARALKRQDVLRAQVREENSLPIVMSSQVVRGQDSRLTDAATSVRQLPFRSNTSGAARDERILSDGIPQLATSSQPTPSLGHTTPGFSMTQPEAGIFGARSGRKPGKKKRRAGF